MSELRYPNESRAYRDARDAIAPGRTGTRRQGESRCGKTPQASVGRPVERGLRLPVGQRREGRSIGEILRAVRRQEHTAAVLVHVRSQLGQPVSVLHVARRRVRSHRVPSHSRCCVRGHCESSGGKNQRMGSKTRLVADRTGFGIALSVPSRLQMPGRLRRHAIAGVARVSTAGGQDLPFLGHRTGRKSRRHGLALLESDGLYAGGSTGPYHSAADFQIRVPRKALLEQELAVRLASAVPTRLYIPVSD